MKFYSVLLMCFISSHFVFAQKPIKKRKAHFTYQIIKSNNNTFGYEIFCDKKKIIHQPNIPALAGNPGFKTKERAQIVAKLVIKKITKGQMPPTVSVEEMKKLNALD